MYVNEDDNDVAEKSVDVVLDYIKRNSKLGLKVDIRRVSGNRTDSKGILDTCESKYYLNLIKMQKNQ